MTYILVTGAAGFLGSNLIRMLNALSVSHILAVDDFSSSPEKFKNLLGCSFSEYLDKDECMDRIVDGDFHGKIQSIIHLGAMLNDSSDIDPQILLENNYRYPINLYEFANEEKIPFIYASSAAVYGHSNHFVEDENCEKPHTFYAYSKFLFDQYVLSHHDDRFPAVGLRFFTLYGLGEFFKKEFASIAYKAYCQYRQHGFVNVITTDPDEKGQQYWHDFVHIDDAVRAILFFLNHQHSGIFNVGTGKSVSFDEIVTTVINTIRASHGDDIMNKNALRDARIIRHVPTDTILKDQLQSFTEAYTKKLHSAGFTHDMLDASSGVAKYINSLMHHEYSEHY